MTTGATPAVNTAARHDRGSVAVTFLPLAHLQFQPAIAAVCGGECGRWPVVVLHINMPPAAVVDVTFNGTVTAGMCLCTRQLAAPLPAVSENPG